MCPQAQRREFQMMQAEEMARRRELQQMAWERGTSMVRTQTLRKARRQAERSLVMRQNSALQGTISRTMSRERPMSVA